MKLIQHCFKWLFRAFNPILTRVINVEGLYRFNIDLEKVKMLQKAFIFCVSNWVNGDYLEFGVYGGKTFIEAIKQNKLYNGKIRCIGFDSFEGLPEPHSIHDNHGGVQELGEQEQKWQKGMYSCSINDFKKNLKKAGIDEKSYLIYKGFYGDILTPSLQKILKKAAIVHIDCDLYISTKSVLEFIKPLLQTGTIILFDDYYCFKGDPNKGEALALSEFLETNPSITMRHWDNYHFSGAAFIVKVKDQFRGK